MKVSILSLIMASLILSAQIVEACTSNCALDTDCNTDWTMCATGTCCGKIVDSASGGAGTFYRCISSTATTYSGSVSCTGTCSSSCVANVDNGAGKMIAQSVGLWLLGATLI